MITRTTAALRDFLAKESAGGLVLIAAATLALIVANSTWAGHYFGTLAFPLQLSLGPLLIDKPLLLWINDGLMAIFFFLIGLEVKREFLDGQLSSRDRASLPLFAALGGILAPAVIYLAVNAGSPANQSGWAIPAATDIAFALGVLALLGPRVPVALKALLLAIAVIDDIAAITIIALFYSGAIDVAMLAGAGAALAVLVMVSRMGVASAIPYVLLALVMWVFVLKSGVHATLAGVVAALTVPMVARDGSRPLEKIEHGLHPWVAFLVIPVFGFANAGVSLTGLTLADLFAPLPLGIALGLLIGKQVGIVGMAYLAVRAGLARLPEGVGWRAVHGVSLLAAIGFTMSLFIGNLAFADQAQIDAVKLGVLGGSLIAGLAGFAYLRAILPAASRH